MNTDKIKRLILEATEDSNLRDKLRRDSRDVALLQAREYGANVPITEKMLKYATRIGDTDKMAQASEAYRATRLAQALGDNDIKFIVDHADVLNQQGKNALIQLLLERNDTANLYGLNKNLGNEFINKDLKNKVGRDKAKLLDEAVANQELQQKFYSKLDDDETAAELRGMSVDPRTDPARSRLIADRMRHGQTVDTSVDEMFNTARMPGEARDIDNISIDELGNHPRYKKWIADEERRLRGKVPSSSVKDVHPTRAQTSKRNRASDIKDRSEILEQAINNRYGSVDNLRNTLKDVPEGAERFYDEAADLLNKYDDAIDEASGYGLRDELGDIDEDNVFNQFIDSRDQDRIKPTPRSRDYGEESLMLRDRARGIGPKQTPDDRRKELIELASKSKDKDVPVYRGGEKPAYFTTEKEALRDVYPKHTRIENEKIPAKSGEYKNPLEAKATELFIKNVAKQLGFRPSEQLIEELKKYSKQSVIDWYENLAHPYIKPKSRR